jgi:hypothetical protein
MARRSAPRHVFGVRLRLLPALLALVLAATLVGLALAEFAVRRAGLAGHVAIIDTAKSKSAFQLSDNPLLGYVFKNGYQDHDHPDLQESFPFINSHGQRDVERTWEKPPGIRRIILLGDSDVSAHGVEDLNDTISRKLETKLDPSSIEVLNMGIGGYGLVSELELLATKGVKYSPDLVILLFERHDFVFVNSQIGHYFRAPFGIVPLKWAYRSHLFRYLIVRRRMRAEHLNLLAAYRAGGGLPRLRRLADEYHFKAFIAFWPYFSKTDIFEVQSRPLTNEADNLVPATGETEIERLGQESHIAVFRLSPYFVRDYAERRAAFGAQTPNPAATYTTCNDATHPNRLATEIVANALRDILREHPEYLRSANSEQ